MLQKILTVRRTVFHLTYDTDQLWVQAMDAKVNSCTLTRLDNLVVKLLFHLGDNLLDACRMNTTVSNQLMESEPADFAANRIKGRDDNRLRRIVDDNFNTRCSFQSTDITPLTADDTSLDLITVDMKDTYRVLDGGLGGSTLDRLDDDFLRLLVGIELCLVYDFIDVRCSIEPCLILQALYQPLLCLFRTEAGEFFELRTFLLLHLLKILLFDLKRRLISS